MRGCWKELYNNYSLYLYVYRRNFSIFGRKKNIDERGTENFVYHKSYNIRDGPVTFFQVTLCREIVFDLDKCRLIYSWVESQHGRESTWVEVELRPSNARLKKLTEDWKLWKWISSTNDSRCNHFLYHSRSWPRSFLHESHSSVFCQFRSDCMTVLDTSIW